RSRPADLAATGGLTTTPATAIGAAGATGAGSTPGAAGAAAPATDDDHAPGAAGTDGFAGLRDVDHYDDPVAFPPIRPPSLDAAEEARARHLSLTKPAGSLGRLEELGAWIASCQDSCPPRRLERPRVVVFAGDHGVARHGVSAFPTEVTLQMADNIVAGGSAVSVLARAAGATVRVADLSMASGRPGELDDHKIRRSSGATGRAGGRPPDEVDAHAARRSSGATDREAALTREEVRAATAAGCRIADDEADSGADLLVAGDLGTGNPPPATVLTCLVTGREPVELVGRGTGI